MKQSGNGAGREPRSVTILGSTGSVGQSTVDLIARNPESFDVVALTARRSVTLLAQQARELNAKLAVVSDESCYADLKEALSGCGVEVAAGDAAVVEAASRSADFTMAAIVGSAGLLPTLSAVRRGAIVGLANKETLVCAGNLMITAVAQSGAKLLPVDSEHNAIFQVLEKDQPEAVSRIILTASGGPFRLRSREEMAQMTPAQADDGAAANGAQGRQQPCRTDNCRHGKFRRPRRRLLHRCIACCYLHGATAKCLLQIGIAAFIRHHGKFGIQLTGLLGQQCDRSSGGQCHHIKAFRIAHNEIHGALPYRASGP